MHLCGEVIFKPDDLDEVIHACLLTARSLKSKLNDIQEWTLQESRTQHHNYIADSLLRQEKFDQFIEEKKRHFRQLQSWGKDGDATFSRMILWEIAIAHFKNGQYLDVESILLKLHDDDMIMPSVIVRQQLYKLLLKLKIDNNELQEWSVHKDVRSASLYDREQIEELDIRLEMNQLFVQFLQGQYQDCLNHIEDLKLNQKRRISTNRQAYRDLLFLELLASHQNHFFSNQDSILRSLDKLCETDTFEHLARKVLIEVTKYSPSIGEKSFADQNPEKVKKLETFSKNGEPLHALILSFLRGNFRPSRNR